MINNVIIEKDDAAYFLLATVLTGTLCYWPSFTLKTHK